MRAGLVAGLALLAAFVAAPASAQPIDFSSGGPVSVTARDGFEWREAEQVVIAAGDARAVRGEVTVLADRLLAHYRKKSAGPAADSPLGEGDAGTNEIYRLEAIGHVRIVTPTDEAVGDKAVYDIDQAVLVMTGSAMRLSTPQYVMTARDSMEYWSLQHMAVGRGNAVVVATDGRRLSGDVLVGYVSAPSTAAKPVATKPAGGGDSGKLERVEAFGNVEVRTATDTVRGARAAYVPDLGIARVLGNVQVVHGQNVITGAAADVNMKTGIAHIVADPAQRVQGMIVPTDPASAPAGNAPAARAVPARPAAGGR
jgi:lipopolysaccharide export system protein LptA